MSRLDLLTIAIVVVCLGALGYLVYKIVKLMNPPEEGPVAAIQDTYTPPENDESTYNYDEEVDSAATTDYEADLDDDEVATSYGDESEYDTSDSGIAEEGASNTDRIPETEPVREERIPTTTPTATATAVDGQFLVIAGSYRQRTNADIQAARLRRMGYNSTEVELFDRGSYAVVLVDRFDNLSAARNLINELSNKGVDAFVKRKD